ncbi:MAG: hypothetical protein RL398_2165 [Planctomycetota bacterium]
MVPLALYLLSLCSPQLPQGPTAPPATLVTPPLAEDELAELHRLERLGTAAPADAIAALTNSADLTIARRATWLLGRAGGRDRGPALRELARDSRDAEIRLHALMGLQKDVDQAALQVAADRLGDADLSVRIAAAQLLGRARSAEAADELLAFVQRSARSATSETDPRDVEAALIALHDLQAGRHLLPVAEALRNSTLSGTGKSLTYYWQDVSPKLPKADEVTMLRAALDHREPLLRRYAIARLGELDDPAAVPALEARVGIEEAELEPLLEATLRFLRRDAAVGETDDLERAKANLAAITANARGAWQDLGRDGQLLALSGVGGAAFLLLVITLLARRRRAATAHAAAVAAATALVAPSADPYLAAETDVEDGEYVDEPAYESGAEFEPYDDPSVPLASEYQDQEADEYSHASSR